jgi:2-amino-4-hydroxy-6-hydroxymethyldihydropteridine diphosphokinase
VKKQLSNTLSLYFNNLYPFKISFISDKRNFITIGVGGNIGNVTKRFKQLFLMLQKDSRFTLIETSPLLQNPPFGYTQQNDFINAIIVLTTNLSASYCLKVFQRYENRFKRTRSFQDAPRTLDIDIIFFNNETINKKDLTIPHIGYKTRQSVQIPLGFISL